MFRKILVSVLCLMLALAMPLSSLAATDVALKIIPGTELASVNENIAPILDKLILHIVSDEDAGLLALESQSGEVASIGLRADENGIYAATAFVGNRILYFTMEDLSAAMVEMMRQGGADEATIAEFEQMMAQAMAQGTSASLNTLIPSETMTDEEAYEAMIANDPAMQQFIENLEKKMVVTEGNFTDPAFNPATTKTELVMTVEDMKILLGSQMMLDMYASMAQSAGMTAEELIAKVQDVFNQIEMTYNIVAYTTGAGEEEELCALQMDMIAKGDITLNVTDEKGNTTAKTGTVDMTMDMDANVLTTGAVDNIAVNVLMTETADTNTQPIGCVMNIASDNNTDAVAIDGNLTEGGQEVIQFKGAFAEVKEDALNGWIALLAEGEQVTFAVSGKKANEVLDGQLSIYFRSDCTAIVEPTWSDGAMISFAMQAKEVETPEMLNALKAATPETSVQLLQMSSDELNNEINAIAGDATSALFTALGKLPPELMNLLMTVMPME